MSIMKGSRVYKIHETMILLSYGFANFFLLINLLLTTTIAIFNTGFSSWSYN